jgi:hypothetical protein
MNMPAMIISITLSRKQQNIGARTRLTGSSTFSIEPIIIKKVKRLKIVIVA